MTRQFNELEYREQLIAKGIDPDMAFDLARRTADGKGLPPSQSVSNAEGPTKQEATKKAPAKRRSKTSKKGSITKKEKKLIDSGLQIAEKEPGNDDLTFMHLIMCQVGLPRSKVINPAIK